MSQVLVQPTNLLNLTLRSHGLVPIPRWWVTPEDLELIKYMADQHAAQVKEIMQSNNVSKRVHYHNPNAYVYNGKEDD